jgi:hypothetical protein
MLAFEEDEDAEVVVGCIVVTGTVLPMRGRTDELGRGIRLGGGTAFDDDGMELFGSPACSNKSSIFASMPIASSRCVSVPVGVAKTLDGWGTS